MFDLYIYLRMYSTVPVHNIYIRTYPY